MGKNKGRQAGTFHSKSERVAHSLALHEQIGRTIQQKQQRRLGVAVVDSSRNCSTATSRNAEQQQQQPENRPRLVSSSLGRLRGLLRERQCHDAYQLRLRRRRDGFLPQQQQRPSNSGIDGGTTTTSTTTPTKTRRRKDYHPPGWIVNYHDGNDDDRPSSYNNYCHNQNTVVDNMNDSELLLSSSTKSNNITRVRRLQDQCLHVFAKYIHDYLDVMGRDELHTVMSILPADSLTELSILLSSSSSSSNTTLSADQEDGYNNGGGINDDLAYILGRHRHVERLCFRASSSLPSTTGDSYNDHNNNDRTMSTFTSTTAISTTTKTTTTTLTDHGLSELIPQFTIHRNDDDVLDCWEDDDDNDDEDHNNGNDYSHNSTTVSDDDVRPGETTTTSTIKDDDDEEEEDDDHDHYSFRGCNIRLRRLELLDCQQLSPYVVARLLENCSGITHLSLAGSFVKYHDHHDHCDNDPYGHKDDDDNHSDWSREKLLQQLPSILPNLQVLDVTRCPWVTRTLVNGIVLQYTCQRQQQQQEQQHPRQIVGLMNNNDGTNHHYDSEQQDNDTNIHDDGGGSVHYYDLKPYHHHHDDDDNINHHCNSKDIENNNILNNKNNNNEDINNNNRLSSLPVPILPPPKIYCDWNDADTWEEWWF